MATVLEVEHITHYRYRRPVRFGEHRLMFRPRAGHDIQVFKADVDVNVPVRIDRPLAAHAQRWPFDYSTEERRDLGAMLEPHHTDPHGRLYEWMRPFLAPAVRPDTRELLSSMAEAIKSGLKYETRDE